VLNLDISAERIQATLMDQNSLPPI